MLNSKGLISFDEISQTNLEAASIGLPVFIANKCFPSSSMANFPISDLKIGLHLLVINFYLWLKGKLIPYKVDYLEEYNELTFSNIKNILNNNHIPIKKLSKDNIKDFKFFSKFLKQKMRFYQL